MALTRSLGGRLGLLVGLNVLLFVGVTAVALGIGTPNSLQEFMLRSAEPRVFDVSRLLAIEMPSIPRAELDGLLTRYSTSYGATFMLMGADGQRVAGARLEVPAEVRTRLFVRQGVAVLQTPPAQQPLPIRTPFMYIDGKSPRYWMAVRLPIRSASSPEVLPGTLLVASPTFFRSSLFFAPGKWLLWAAVALSLGALLWLPFLRGLTRRIAQMERATALIANGQFSSGLDTTQPDELGRLAASIERMAQQLGTQLAAQKRFLGDTAHELRSPLARMQVALAILERNDAMNTSVSALLDDVSEMSQMTDDLLQLAREDLIARTAKAVPTNVRRAVERAVRIECRNNEDVRVDVPADLMAMMDPDALARAIGNALRNAVRYAGSAGPIAINAAAEGDRVNIAVADRGPGVPPESLSRLFEPFYRVDEARDRKTGGVGMGLAIVHSSVQACGGTASCRNLEPHGLEVRMSLLGVGARNPTEG